MPFLYETDAYIEGKKFDRNIEMEIIGMSTKKQSVSITAERRAEIGINQVKKMRRTGLMPCVVYGSDSEPCHIKIVHHDLETLLRHTAGQNPIIDLVIDKEPPKKVLIREIQRHSLSDRILHADFLEISMTQTLRVDIEVETVGDPVGVTQEGGLVDRLIRSVSVECLPGDLVDNFEIDISSLRVGDTLLVKDIPHDPSITILTQEDLPVVTVAMHRVEEEAVEDDEADAAEATVAEAAEKEATE